MKFANEESVRNVNLKNEEIENLMEQLEVLGDLIEKKENMIADLNQNIMLLEMKNRKMSQLINEQIYGKTQGNIESTLDILKN